MRILILSLFVSALAFANACTAVADGNWNSAGTWGVCGGATPGVGDTATITNHVVTATANVAVGNDTVGNVINVTGTGKLIINTGINVTARGWVTLNCGTTGGVVCLQLGAGSGLWSDPSVLGSPLGFTLREHSIIQTSATTEGSNAYIGTLAVGAGGATNVRSTITTYVSGPGGYLDADYLTFQRLGTNAGRAITLRATTSGGAGYDMVRCAHCTFDGVGNTLLVLMSADGKFRFDDTRWINMYPNTVDVLEIQGGAYAAPAHSSWIKNSVMGDGIQTYGISVTSAAPGFDVDGVLSGGMNAVGYSYAVASRFLGTVNNSLMVQTAQKMHWNWSGSGNYTILDMTEINEFIAYLHAFQTGMYWTDGTFMMTGAPHAGIGNGDMFQATGSLALSVDISRNIYEPMYNNMGAGKMYAITGATLAPGNGGCATVTADDNLAWSTTIPATSNTWESGIMQVGETTAAVDCGAGQVTSFKRNISYAPTGFQSQLMSRAQSTTSDFVTRANATDNWCYLCRSDGSNAGFIRWDASTPFFSDGNITTSDLLGTADPRLVDQHRGYAYAATRYFDNLRGITVTRPNWTNGATYAYHSYVTVKQAGIWDGEPIAYYCINPAGCHATTGDATNGLPEVALNWRTNWQYATYSLLAANMDELQPYLRWQRGGWAVQNGNMRRRASGGVTPGPSGFDGCHVIAGGVCQGARTPYAY